MRTFNRTKNTGRPSATLAAVLALALLLCLPAGPLLAQAAGGQDRQEGRRKIAAMVEAATVYVVAEESDGFSSGTGFVVAPGYIMTNAHVVSGARGNRRVYVANQSLPMTEARVVDSVLDRTQGQDVGGWDFALLKYDQSGRAALPVLTFNLDVSRMDRVGAWGYPGIVTQFDRNTKAFRDGLGAGSFRPPPVVYTEGAISTVVENEGGGHTIFHTAEITKGNSGGPLVNNRGEVVGINTWEYAEVESARALNISIMAAEILDFLKLNNITPRLAPGQTHVARRTGRGAVSGYASARPPRRPEAVPGSRLDLGRFTVDVPRGWSVSGRDEDYVLLAMKSGDGLLYLGMEDSDGRTLERIAYEHAINFDGKMPKGSEEEGIFMVDGMLNGKECLILLSKSKKADSYAVVIMTGGLATDDILSVLDGIVEK